MEGPTGVGFVVGGNVVSAANVFSQMSTFQIRLRDASTSQRAQDPAGSSAKGFEARAFCGESGRGSGRWSGMSTTRRSVARSPRSFTSATRSRRASAWWCAGVTRNGAVTPDRLRSNSSASTELKMGDDLFGFGTSLPWTGPAMPLSPALMAM